MPNSNRLVLPLIDAAQAQKHVTHNEALTALDALVQLSVSTRDVTAAPSAPTEGTRVLVGVAATGVFAGHDGALASFDNGGWSFSTPRAGWRLHVADENALLIYNGTAWTDIGLAIRSLQNLSGVGIGTTSDATNAFAAKVNAGLFTARATGEGGTGDMRVVLNKSTTSNTASSIYQANYSARAEAGLAGNDDFTIKVSPDGATWHTGLVVDASTGAVSFPSGVGGGIARLRSGTSAPSGAAGAGDFWIDTAANRLYGPYVGPSWPTTFLSLGSSWPYANVVPAASVSIMPNGSDMTAALTTALASLYALGGGVIQFDGGTYRFDGQIKLPYDGAATAPKSVPFAFQGVGEWRSGKSTASVPNGGTQFDIRWGCGSAWTASTAYTVGAVVTSGGASYRCTLVHTSGASFDVSKWSLLQPWLIGVAEGTFAASGITFTQKGALAQASPTPFFLFTNTVPQISRCSFEGQSGRTAANADQDCIVLGGSTNTSYGGDDPTQPFQGYGAVIERCHFNRIRRGIFGRVYANGIVVRDNTFWAQCGGAEAIRFDSGTSDYCVGGVIEGNLIEMPGYTNGITMTRCQHWLIAGNNFYDPQAIAQAYVVLTACNQMMIIAGAHVEVVSGNSRPYVNDVAQCKIFLSSNDLTPSRIRQLTAGEAGYPNKFGPTTFAGGANNTLIQPDADQASSVNKLLTIKRPASNSTGTPSAEIFSVDNSGAIALNPTGDTSMINAGNITNGLSYGAGWSANGRTWSANGTGSNFTQFSGSGGSYFYMRNYAAIFTRWYDNAQIAQIGPQFGGAGLEGIGFGASNDVSLYRSAAGALGILGVPIVPTYTVSSLPAAASSLKGARATVTDATASPAYGATASGGGSMVAGVLCTGSAWVYG